MDAQWFGLAQRRERVFALADFGAWQHRPPLLLEREGLRGDSPPVRQEKQNATRQLACAVNEPTNTYRMTAISTYVEDDCASTIKARDHKDATDLVGYFLTGGDSNSMKSSNPDAACKIVGVAPTLDSTTPCPAKNQGGLGIVHNNRLRRLTPLECERLMGFPDSYTSSLSKTNRYKVLGNSMAVPVLTWIGERLKQAIAA